MRRPARGRDEVHVLNFGDAQRALDQLHERAYNYRLADEPIDRAHGWTVDSYCQPLPAEPPGDPLPDGSWAIARQLIESYAFADPSIIRAVYHADDPLLHRDMLLEGRFYGLRFFIGVRVAGVVDTTHEVDARPVRAWGWCYRTLQGHLEMGEMTYQVWKWLDTGNVEFHIDRYVKPRRMPNPIIRLGWALFGRWMQVRFVRRCQRRMSRLVADRLAGRDSGDADAAHGALRVLPAAADRHASARIADASRSEPAATTGC
jgi:uncharacterized protein (UPF0548 family)